MKRIRKLKRGAVTVIVLVILVAVGIAFMRGAGEQENKAHVAPPEQDMH